MVTILLEHTAALLNIYFFVLERQQICWRNLTGTRAVFAPSPATYWWSAWTRRDPGRMCLSLVPTARLPSTGNSLDTTMKCNLNSGVYIYTGIECNLRHNGLCEKNGLIWKGEKERWKSYQYIHILLYRYPLRQTFCNVQKDIIELIRNKVERFGYKCF